MQKDKDKDKKGKEKRQTQDFWKVSQILERKEENKEKSKAEKIIPQRQMKCN
ncbi:hypothetical protein [Mariniphaga anaerophila]|uniref:hypothetical protein n=1 Tax=Mariniphaga anaerophila TaxID=1484053 RepID=UPI001587303B|nr:hypothetical protein [Mariniphaga anaerophila]